MSGDSEQDGNAVLTKATLKAAEMFQCLKDTRELLEDLWQPVPYEAQNLLRRIKSLITEIEP